MKYSYNVFFIILWGLFISCSSDDPAVDSNEGKDDKEIKKILFPIKELYSPTLKRMIQPPISFVMAIQAVVR